MQDNEIKEVQVEVEEKQTKTEEKKSAGQILINAFKGMGYDFVQSFKYNNMKLAGLLILIPGAIFGFFLVFHTGVVNSIISKSTLNEDGTFVSYLSDYSGFMLFMMMLFGILNIFTGFSVMNKRNLGSVIIASVTSVVMIVAGILYFVVIIKFFKGTNIYFDQLDKMVAALKEKGVQGTDAEIANNYSKYILSTGGIEPTTGQNWYVFAVAAKNRVSDIFNVDYVMSFMSVGLCMICSVIGCALGFKNYDRNYQKVDR